MLSSTVANTSVGDRLNLVEAHRYKAEKEAAYAACGEHGGVAACKQNPSLRHLANEFELAAKRYRLHNTRELGIKDKPRFKKQKKSAEPVDRTAARLKQQAEDKAAYVAYVAQQDVAKSDRDIQATLPSVSAKNRKHNRSPFAGNSGSKLTAADSASLDKELDRYMRS